MTIKLSYLEKLYNFYTDIHYLGPNSESLSEKLGFDYVPTAEETTILIREERAKA